MTVSVFNPATAPKPTQQITPDFVESTHPKAKKVFIETQGCQMNVYDSEKMAKRARRLPWHGFDR